LGGSSGGDGLWGGGLWSEECGHFAIASKQSLAALKYRIDNTEISMLTQAFWTSLRILVFRAGPEDLPYDPGPGLTRASLLSALLAFTVLLALLMPPLAAAATAAAGVAALWVVTRTTLRLRRLQNRFQQTINALLLTNALLTLLMIPPFAKVAPVIVEYYRLLLQHPELANHPENWPQPAVGPSSVLDLLGLWQLIVCSRIFGRSASVSGLGGLAILALCAATAFLILMFVAPLLFLS
jgi:hypothetical protein